MATKFVDPFLVLERPGIVATLVNEGEESFKNDLQQVLEALQQDRATKLAEIRELQLAAHLLFGIEAARIADTAPSDTRAMALADAAAAAMSRVFELHHEIDIASTRVPMVKKTEALVHGHVTDALDRGAAGVSVLLADENGVEVRGVKPAVVDTSGYFAMVVPPEVSTEFGEAARLHLVLERDGERITPRFESPITLKPGFARNAEIKLGEAELEKLRLTRASGSRRAAPKRKPTSVKSKRGAKK